MLGRLARIEELSYLQDRLLESGFTQSDLKRTPCFVTEAADGELTGMLPLRLLTRPVKIWQGEPLLVFPEIEQRMTRRRSMYLLWKTAERWIGSPLNLSGVRRYLAITYQEDVKRLFDHGGLTRLGKDEAEAFQHLTTDKDPEFFFRQISL